MTLKEQIKSLDYKSKLIYNKIHNDNYKIEIKVVKKTCKNYYEVYFYASNLVYRNIGTPYCDIFSALQYKKLVEIISSEFNKLFFVI